MHILATWNERRNETAIVMMKLYMASGNDLCENIRRFVTKNINFASELYMYVF